MLASAFSIEGRRVRGLDLTDGTISAGPMLSQLQVCQGNEPPAATVASGADVLLAFDLLTTTAPRSQGRRPAA
jgi:Pyruvate/2-oxoacid:ferredoxin oxidoreductase gamma subunit